MNVSAYQKIGLLPIFASSELAYRKGVRHGLDACGGAADGGVLYSIYPAHFPAGAGPDSRGDHVHAATHGHWPAPSGGRFGQGTLERLSPRAVAARLVQLAAGACPGQPDSGTGSARPAGGHSGGRHQSAAQGPARLRQGAASRRDPFDPQPHRVGVGVPARREWCWRST
jgi:hypothetical protein